MKQYLLGALMGATVASIGAGVINKAQADRVSWLATQVYTIDQDRGRVALADVLKACDSPAGEVAEMSMGEAEDNTGKPIYLVRLVMRKSGDVAEFDADQRQGPASLVGVEK